MKLRTEVGDLLFCLAGLAIAGQILWTVGTPAKIDLTPRPALTCADHCTLYVASIQSSSKPPQGPADDAAIDQIKGVTVDNECTCDEGGVRYINPLHSFLPDPLKGPQVYLPGVHQDGTVDFEW